MKPTRLTQPYRTSGSRAPSPVLDAMQRGRAGPAQPGALQAAFQRRPSKRAAKTVLIPRSASPRGRNMPRNGP